MMGESWWHKLANQKKNPLNSSHHAFWWATFFTLIYSKKIRDILMNTSNKEWLQAVKLRAISFLVWWSLPQSNSHNKGNIKLRTCRALQVCTMVPYCFFGLLACATEILPSWLVVSNYSYILYFWENTRHANERFQQRVTSSSPITCDQFFCFMVFVTEQLPY